MYKELLKSTAAVILAAGRGTRLNCVDMPKVMMPIGGKPIVEYIIRNLQDMGFSPAQICLVVGFKQEAVRQYFGDEVTYAAQDQQLGTAHAAYTGIAGLPGNIENVLVLNGDDSAFYTKETLANFIFEHLHSGAPVSLLTVELSDPTMYGRIVRGTNGGVEIIEKESLTDEQKKINETSTGTFCFSRKWFEEMFPRMPRMKKLGEFGLPTTFYMAADDGLQVRAVKLKNNNEWFGVNTPAELAEADRKKRII
jgi:bifunctional UDP-N-acetylglucosamine pyrophosphorylase / glucosamine-1-phosphate N-acetyltransferase